MKNTRAGGQRAYHYPFGDGCQAWPHSPVRLRSLHDPRPAGNAL